VPGTLQNGTMQEGVARPIAHGDKPKTLLRVEPLDGGGQSGAERGWRAGAVAAAVQSTPVDVWCGRLIVIEATAAWLVGSACWLGHSLISQKQREKTHMTSRSRIKLLYSRILR
jgi:hypothetical protein